MFLVLLAIVDFLLLFLCTLFVENRQGRPVSQSAGGRCFFNAFIVPLDPIPFLASVHHQTRCYIRTPSTSGVVRGPGEGRGGRRFEVYRVRAFCRKHPFFRQREGQSFGRSVYRLVGPCVGFSVDGVGRSVGGLVVRLIDGMVGRSVDRLVRWSGEREMLPGWPRRHALILRRLAVFGPLSASKKGIILVFRSVDGLVGRSIIGSVGRAADRQTGTCCRDDYVMVSRLTSHGR